MKAENKSKKKEFFSLICRKCILFFCTRLIFFDYLCTR